MKVPNEANVDTMLSKTKDYVDSGLNNKQDTLTFDNTPTTNSNNPVTSGGIKSYVDSAIQTSIVNVLNTPV